MGLIGAFSIAIFSFVMTAERAVAQLDLPTVFIRPLIMGASVSSGYATTSPGERAAAKYTTRLNIKNIAQNGKAGQSYTGINASFLKPYSIVLAIDFVFWDSTQSSPAGGIKAVDNLIKSAAQAGIPLVLGDVPHLLGWQQTHPALNRHIHSVCKTENGCYILKFFDLHQKAVKEGIVINGKRYFYRDLADDGLHPNAIGAEYIAGMIISQLKGLSLTGDEDVWLED